MAMTDSAPLTAASWTMFCPTPPTATTATDSPVRTSPTFRTAPYAVNSEHPRIAESARSSSSGSANTAVAGVTLYSARPPMEYMESGSPSARWSLVSPS